MRSWAWVRSGLSTSTTRRSPVVGTDIGNAGRAGAAPRGKRSVSRATRRSARASSTSPARPITRFAATTSRRHSAAASSRVIRAIEVSVPRVVRP